MISETITSAYHQIISTISSDTQLFPRIDILSAEKSGTLSRVKAIPSIGKLVDEFRQANLAVNIGYNASSCEISFTVDVKVRRFPFRTDSSRTYLQLTCRLFHYYNCRTNYRRKIQHAGLA